MLNLPCRLVTGLCESNSNAPEPAANLVANSDNAAYWVESIICSEHSLQNHFSTAVIKVYVESLFGRSFIKKVQVYLFAVSWPRPHICSWWHYSSPWWRHQMETFSALLALCVGNSPVTGEFPSQWPVTRSFDVFFDILLNKRSSIQSWLWWFETPSRLLWRHRNAFSYSS